MGKLLNAFCVCVPAEFFDRLPNGDYTVSQKKFPPLNSLYLCQILTNFQNFCTAEKRMKFDTKTV